jgi:hypothetical protein
MNKGRCLGLVGGLGVDATLHYYQKLAKVHEEHGRTLDIVITNAEIARVRNYVEASDRNGLAAYLISFIHRMKAAGAESAAVPAVTPHLCVRELIAASCRPAVPVKSLNMVLTTQRLRFPSSHDCASLEERSEMATVRTFSLCQLQDFRFPNAGVAGQERDTMRETGGRNDFVCRIRLKVQRPKIQADLARYGPDVH